MMKPHFRFLVEVKKSLSFKIILSVAGLLGLALFFQNCSKANFTPVSEVTLASCSTPACDQIAAGTASCSFNGLEVLHLQSVTAYLNSTVPTGTTCASEKRVCNNGILSGSYNYASCSAQGERDCQFNGQTIKHGNKITAYLSSSVPHDKACASEERVCKDGVLSGAFPYATCQVAAANACLFNGQTIASGSGVFAFKNSSVKLGLKCENEYRICTNGVLGGSFAYASCSIEAPASCLFNGQSIASGQTVQAFQNSTVPYGQACAQQTRSCSNGALSGSYTYPVCSVGAPAACQFNGQTIAHGQTIVAYQNSTVTAGSICAAENRTCTNGNLSGSFAFASCSPSSPAACLFNGQTVSSGQSVLAYEKSSVAAGEKCVSQNRTCIVGNLSGTFAYSSCTVAGEASCSFNGQTIPSGSSVKAYQSSTVPLGQSCQWQDRVCRNGTLSGSFPWASCGVGVASSCQFNGQSVAHGQQVTAFATASVPFGSDCGGEIRTCNNGSLSGSYAYGSCTIDPPKPQDPPPSELWTWLPTFYQTTCPGLCDGQQQVRCEGTGCPGRTYWHYAASAPGQIPYPAGSTTTTRPAFIGSVLGQRID